MFSYHSTVNLSDWSQKESAWLPTQSLSLSLLLLMKRGVHIHNNYGRTHISQTVPVWKKAIKKVVILCTSVVFTSPAKHTCELLKSTKSVYI